MDAIFLDITKKQGKLCRKKYFTLQFVKDLININIDEIEIGRPWQAYKDQQRLLKNMIIIAKKAVWEQMCVQLENVI